MKKVIIVFFSCFIPFIILAQELPINKETPSSTITVKECEQLMRAVNEKKEATTKFKNKVEKVAAAVESGKKNNKAGALEIAEAVEGAPAEVSVETKKAANKVAKAVLYQEDLKDAMQAFERIVNADIARLTEEVLQFKETVGKHETRIGNLETVVVKHDTEIKELQEAAQKTIYGLATFGFSFGLNKGIADMTLGLGIGIPFRYFTIEGGVSGGLDLVTNNLTSTVTAGMIFPLKDWGDKGEISFLFNGMFHSVIKLPEDNVNKNLLGLGYYGGGNIGVRHVLPVGENKVSLLFQGDVGGMYGEGRVRDGNVWRRTLNPIVVMELFFGVLF